VDQARRWLAAGGGEWPEADAEVTGPSRRGRPRGSTKRTAESIAQEAIAAARSGMSWRAFYKKHHLERVEGVELLDALEAPFREAPEDSLEPAPETPSMRGTTR
jgi:hypothetical protein